MEHEEISELEKSFIKNLSRNIDADLDIHHFDRDGKINEWFKKDILEKRIPEEFEKLSLKTKEKLIGIWQKKFPADNDKIDANRLTDFLGRRIQDKRQYSHKIERELPKMSR